MALIEQSFIPRLSQHPPDAFNIIVGQRDIGIIEVDPESDALCHPSPVLLVLEHVLLTLFDKVLNAVSLQFCLVCDIELLFDLIFDRESVGVPNRLSGGRNVLSSSYTDRQHLS